MWLCLLSWGELLSVDSAGTDCIWSIGMLSTSCRRLSTAAALFSGGMTVKLFFKPGSRRVAVK